MVSSEGSVKGALHVYLKRNTIIARQQRRMPLITGLHQPKHTAFERSVRRVYLHESAFRAVFLNPGRERPEETTVCYKISLGQLITNLNVILYLSTCHTVYISVLILFMIMT
jgi:hypothetical protein